ncbi:hypothetical protein D623_10010065 [Myotis brandtii]|uniref:Uncharacterized protein n=1 Tax=Myotis brandtii TaxID=109478 RepID=S7MGM8_MYOBR|nr:hypothetical protein D623_10010065 [Myotis brandtii]
MKSQEQCDMVTIYCLTAQSVKRVRQGREERVMLQTEAGQGVLRLPSFGPDEAAPSQKLCED